jgi:uncharacterized protein
LGRENTPTGAGCAARRPIGNAAQPPLQAALQNETSAAQAERSKSCGPFGFGGKLRCVARTERSFPIRAEVAPVSEQNEPVIRDNPQTSRIEAEVGGQIAYAEYRLSPGTITFTHTRVPEALRGKGIGTRLIAAALSLARERGLEVIPICPFVSAYLRAHPEDQQLLGPQGQRLLQSNLSNPR